MLLRILEIILLTKIHLCSYGILKNPQKLYLILFCGTGHHSENIPEINTVFSCFLKKHHCCGGPWNKTYKIHELCLILFSGSGCPSEIFLKKMYQKSMITLQKIFPDEKKRFFVSEYPFNKFPLKIHFCSYDILKNPQLLWRSLLKKSYKIHDLY